MTELFKSHFSNFRETFAHVSNDLSHNTANASTSSPPSSFLSSPPHPASPLHAAALFSFQAGALEAVVQPEDHSGGPCVHKQPQCVVTLWRTRAAAQGHEQHPQPWTKE